MSARHPGKGNARLGGFALPAIVQGQDGRAGGQQQHKKRSTYRSNTPDGVPSHFDYIDGQWVPSSDWSLNGLNGARHSANEDEEGEGSDSDSAGETTGPGPSTRQNNANNAAPTTTPRIGDDSANDVIDDPLLSTTLGWAKSTNAILGVDIETGLLDDSTTLSGATSTASLSSGGLVTRSNMATYTPLPSSSSSPSHTSVSATSTSTSRSGGANNNAGTAYDFSRDVPNGWISDGRTAAYAVPVIIGLSVFLACVIFGLILALLRMNKSRRRRRKAVLNGKLKLSEEGKLPTRPNSPAPSSTMTRRHSTEDDTNNNHNTGFSSSVRRRSGEITNEENEKNIKRRIIGRKWTPNLSNNTGSLLRKRRKKLAQLFKRDEVSQEIVIDDHQQQVSTSETTGLRRRSLSGSSSAASSRTGSSRRGGEMDDDIDDNTLARSTSHASSLVQNAQEARVANGDEERDTAYIRPPSLRLDTNLASYPSTVEGEEAPQASSPLAISSNSGSAHSQEHGIHQRATQQHARNDSIDHGDHHAVPVPSVGPPAYMQPSTPAYSRAVNNNSSNNSGSGTVPTLAIPPSGYLSNVSTPGISAGMDEKRALLGFSDSSPQQQGDIIPGSSNDAFREQRRYEHLYSSREGDEDEQRTGAPSLAVASSSSSMHPIRNRNDEDIARRAQLEAIEEHRRELQASLVGHVAISDKELLGRLRMAASAPSTTTTSNNNDGTVNDSITPMLNHTGSHFQEASAPSLDETEEDESEQEVVRPQASDMVPTSLNSLLPEPPRPFQHALDRFPQVDEKTRLRQIEETQALSPSSPILFSGLAGNDDAPAPSAPPSSSTTSYDKQIHAPSAPTFSDEDEIEYVQQHHAQTQPSAPPMPDVVQLPSAPTYVLEDDENEEEEEVEEAIGSDPENRPYHEGVV